MNAYFDHAAGTPVNPHLLADLPNIASEFANPSSIHKAGRRAKYYLDSSRKNIAEYLGANPSEIFFCASATQAANIIIRGGAQNRTFGIIVGTAEHDCVLNTVEHMAENDECGLIYRINLRVDGDGVVKPETFQKLLDEEYYSTGNLVIIQLVNNETGAINDVKTLAGMAHEHDLLFICDISQAMGHIPLNLHDLGVDYAFCSCYKYGALHGAGIIYKRDGLEINSLCTGGGQESGVVSGTENLLAIVSASEALNYVPLAKMPDAIDRIFELRKQIIECVNGISDSRINSPDNGSPYILNVSFAGLASEALVLMLDSVGISVSGKSACAGDSIEPSHVLSNMGVPDKYLYGSIRISMSNTTTQAEVSYLCEQLPIAVERLRR